MESVTGPRKLAEYSFLGFDPFLKLRISGNHLEIKDSKDRIEIDDPLQALREFLPKIKLPDKPRLFGGLVGYVSYDSIRYWERLPDKSPSTLEFPDMEFCLFLDGFVFDHLNGRSYYYSFTEDRSNLNLKEEDYEFDYTELNSNMEKESFEEMVKRAKDYIIEGDIFQVVLSRRFEFKIKGEPLKFYENLRRLNPSPYMYYLKFGDIRVIGSSPEMLIRVEGNRAETYPIAGTRPLTHDKEENDRLAKELIKDEKERAEHVMLVDLARNDLGRICKFGSVEVPEFMVIHPYSHVQHLVSRVVGELREGVDCFEALKYVFPAGTVSGAPKIRAMEIIDELEPCRRGIYAGAVGYFSINRNSDFAIAIRTLVEKDGKARIQAGAGIVYDSKPEREWFETEHKAKALIKALEMSVI